MRGLQLGLPPSDMRSRNSCFELDPFVCLHWLLQRMIVSFPPAHRWYLGYSSSECFMLQFYLWNMHLLEDTLNSDCISVSPEEMREHTTCVQITELATQVQHTCQVGWVVGRGTQQQFTVIAAYFAPCTVGIFSCCLQQAGMPLEN